MLFCDHIVSIDNFKILATSDPDFQVKVKESILISRDKPILNKNETSLPLSYLIHHTDVKLYFNDIYYCNDYCINITIAT